MEGPPYVGALQFLANHIYALESQLESRGRDSLEVGRLKLALFLATRRCSELDAQIVTHAQMTNHRCSELERQTQAAVSHSEFTIAECKSMISTHAEQIAGLKKKLGEKNSKLKALNAELEPLRKKHNDKLQEARLQNEQLELMVAENEVLLEKLQQHTERLLDRNTKLETELKKRIGQVLKLERELVEVKHQCNSNAEAAREFQHVIIKAGTSDKVKLAMDLEQSKELLSLVAKIWNDQNLDDKCRNREMNRIVNEIKNVEK
jgi:chromosome segregation ATPase